MTILLDTHSFLWFIAGDARMSNSSWQPKRPANQRKECHYTRPGGNRYDACCSNPPCADW